MQDFRNLTVWQASRRLVRHVYHLTATLPREEDFGLRAQMRRAGVSVCSNIAEGCGRRGDREFRRFLDMAMGSACELECELVLCGDLDLVKEAGHKEVIENLIEIKRMLSGLIRQLSVERNSRKPRAES
jgi:four helix bundle protein